MAAREQSAQVEVTRTQLVLARTETLAAKGFALRAALDNARAAGKIRSGPARLRQLRIDVRPPPDWESLPSVRRWQVLSGEDRSTMAR